MNIWRKLFGKKKNILDLSGAQNVDREIQKFLKGSLSEISVRVDNNRPRSINVFLPDISPNLSAGPLSVLYFIKFLVEAGYHVRLLVDSFKPECELRSILHQQSADLDDAMERIEVEGFKLRNSGEICVNSKDMSVATLFNTAYAAKQIQKKCDDKKFIYFIQDDEREFFAASSLKYIVENIYHWDYYPIFFTSILKDFFLSENVDNLKKKNVPLIDQGCPANYFLPDFEKFKERSSKKKFIFYARPQSLRNCYELAMYIINNATRKGIFTQDWELYGMGFPSKADISLSNGFRLHMLPNMPLDNYKKMLSSFDVGLSLMATPHPSMPPLDLAMSGCIVVTNACKTKTSEVMGAISKNIICGDSTIESLEEALTLAIKKSDDIEGRFKSAKETLWVRNWEEAFGEKHKSWIAEIMK